MRRENRERYYDEEEPSRIRERESGRYGEEEDFGSPHDQGEQASSQYSHGFREYDQRGYEGQNQRRQFGGSVSYREPYREGWGSDSDYSGYRPEPRFEGQYRESYRPPYREDRGYRREEVSRYRGPQRGSWEEDARRSEQRGYPEQSRMQDSREEDRGYRGERGGRQSYNRHEPVRREEPHGLTESRMRDGGQNRPEYRREREFRGEAQDKGEPGTRRSFERSGWGRGRGEAGQYEEWLEEHQGRDRGTEGDRQLEGLRAEHRQHHSDERYEDENRERQRHNQRRFEEGDEREESPGNRATEVRTRSSSRSKPRTTARSGRNK